MASGCKREVVRVSHHWADASDAGGTSSRALVPSIQVPHPNRVLHGLVHRLAFWVQDQLLALHVRDSSRISHEHPFQNWALLPPLPSAAIDLNPVPSSWVCCGRQVDSRCET